jgi:hypothetical protein
MHTHQQTPAPLPLPPHSSYGYAWGLVAFSWRALSPSSNARAVLPKFDALAAPPAIRAYDDSTAAWSDEPSDFSVSFFESLTAANA